MKSFKMHENMRQYFLWLIILCYYFNPFFIVTSDTPKHRLRTVVTAAELDERVEILYYIKMSSKYYNKLISAQYPEERLSYEILECHRPVFHKQSHLFVVQKIEIREHRFRCHPK